MNKEQCLIGRKANTVSLLTREPLIPSYYQLHFNGYANNKYNNKVEGRPTQGVKIEPHLTPRATLGRLATRKS